MVTSVEEIRAKRRAPREKEVRNVSDLDRKHRQQTMALFYISDIK